MRGELTNYDELPESTTIIDYVQSRHQQGLYTFILTTGLPGSGKSSQQQRLAQLISKRIHGEDEFKYEDIVDSLLELLERIQRIKKPGEIVVVEEMSVLFPSRRAMAKDNVAIGRILDTIRKKRIILLANAPLYPSVDSHIRAMAHLLTEAVRINKTYKVVVYRAWRLQTNPISGKTYRHTLTRQGRDVTLFYTRMPKIDVWESYENKKDKFLEELYNKLRVEQEKKHKVKPKVKINKLTAKELELHNLVNVKGLKRRKVAEMLGVSPSVITRRLHNITKKSQISNENIGLIVQKPLEEATS